MHTTRKTMHEKSFKGIYILPRVEWKTFSSPQWLVGLSLMNPHSKLIDFLCFLEFPQLSQLALCETYPSRPSYNDEYGFQFRIVHQWWIRRQKCFHCAYLPRSKFSRGLEFLKVQKIALLICNFIIHSILICFNKNYSVFFYFC